MIKIKPQGSKALATGKNIPNPASTFLETGPKDDLAGADAYAGGAAQFRTGVGSAVGGAVSGLVGGGGANASRSGEMAGRAANVTTQSLWTALLCGSFDVPERTDEDNVERARRTALWLRSTGCSAENLIGLISTEGGKIGLNRDELEKRLSSAMGQSMYTLEPEFREYMIDSMAAMSGQDAATIKVAMRNVQSSVASDKQSDASALAQILSNITGAEETIQIFDLHAEVALIGSLLDKAIELGIPQATETLLEKIDDVEVQRRVALDRLRLAAIGSQLATVRSITRLAGSDAAMAKVPDIITLITQNYSWGYSVQRDEYPAKRDELIETLNLLNPRWHLKRRDGQWVSDLEPFAMASEDALTLFKMSDYSLQAMVAPTYPKQYYATVARKYHPRIDIGYNNIYA